MVLNQTRPLVGYQSERRAGESCLAAKRRHPPSGLGHAYVSVSEQRARRSAASTPTPQSTGSKKNTKIIRIMVLPTFYLGIVVGRRRHRCRFHACDTRGGPRYSGRALSFPGAPAAQARCVIDLHSVRRRASKGNKKTNGRQAVGPWRTAVFG